MTPDSLPRQALNAALRSGGPRTAEGRSASALNALKHGATSQPEHTRVGMWLKIILDKPNLDPGDFLPDTEQGAAALQLATAEARLVMAQMALVDFEDCAGPPSENAEELVKLTDMISLELEDPTTTLHEVRRGKALLNRIARHMLEETRTGGKRHRLLKRYLREAQTGRSRALRRWIETRAM